MAAMEVLNCVAHTPEIRVLEESDKDGKISDWMPKIQEDPKDWDTFHQSITPNLVGRKNCDQQDWVAHICERETW
eukprot:12296620-Ditylum_brightwellii.AAC.1